VSIRARCNFKRINYGFQYNTEKEFKQNIENVCMIGVKEKITNPRLRSVFGPNFEQLKFVVTTDSVRISLT
jgi:hypothetical protein